MSNILGSVQLSFNLFKRSLNLTIYANFKHQKSTGDYHAHLNDWSIGTQALYFIKNIGLGVFYGTRYKNMNPLNCMITKFPQNYGLTMRWGNKHWKVNATISNIFRKSRRAYISDFYSPYYISNSEQFENAYNRNINISIAYIFNYGRKVDSQDEIGVSNPFKSAILQ